ncbi:ZAR1-like protein [Tachyglossus aculeatus]|uniref:ZAR1-like protein n=1 Tax=Tachyglossus aculeatus TaxID=9261 RepID=UPI0018F5BABD|nr:ZAR1-like protein [Tachyglossus aculeatus]
MRSWRPACGGGGPRLRGAATKEVGVQVNARVDAAVQCALGGASPAAGVGSSGLAAAPPTGQPCEGQGATASCGFPRPGPAQQGASSSNKPLFQFLEQKYGYFHCKDCNTRWESAYVWCISGTNKVYFKQLCRKCQKSFNPYRVEAIQCQMCSKSRCSCPQKKRHIDLKRPHRQELCGRCKGKRLSCDSTYSFKYIV